MSFEVTPLVREAGDEWQEATSARFLDGIRDGTLAEEALDRWLVQDRIFVDELFRFQSLVLAKAPEESRGPILDGLVALHDELDWFDDLAAERDLGSAEAHPVCARFTDWLIRSAYTEPFPRLAQILYAIEVVYLAAWSSLAGGDLPGGIHGRLIEHWTNPAFADYVAALAAIAEADPAGDDSGFRTVLRHEREFWRMTVTG